MKFHEKLDEYMSRLGYTAKELSQISGISEATLCRYRKGERLPKPDSKTFEKLCLALSGNVGINRPDIGNVSGTNQPAAGHNSDTVQSATGLVSDTSQPTTGNVSDTAQSAAKAVANDFLGCSDMVAIDKPLFCDNFNTLISLLEINISKLCQYTNYDTSTIFRFRKGQRHPSDMVRFSANVARYVVKELDNDKTIGMLSRLLGCPAKELIDTSIRYEKLKSWLTGNNELQDDSTINFLNAIQNFDINEYLNVASLQGGNANKAPNPKNPAVHKPAMPESQKYIGIENMRKAELNFLALAAASDPKHPVVMYSDMPMSDMAKDEDFVKKWLFGMANLLNTGHHLCQIHSLDRPVPEMMMGLLSWIPMYMTGLVSPYYLKTPCAGPFMHLIKTTADTALIGDAVRKHFADGKYCITTEPNEVSYYNEVASQLLQDAKPLMEIFKANEFDALDDFMNSDLKTEGKRRNIYSSIPLYLIEEDSLAALLENKDIPAKDMETILSHASKARHHMEKLLETSIVEDEIPELNASDFKELPPLMPLSMVFYERDIPFSREEYAMCLRMAQVFAQSHKNYRLKITASQMFRNLQIRIHEGKWVMVSKGKSPAIHFLIHHPKLRAAIENFIPPPIDSIN